MDDAWCCDNAGTLADDDLKKISSKFSIKIDDTPKHFLNMKVEIESSTRVKLSSESYILQMADKYVPNWRSRTPPIVPATEHLQKAYDAAHEAACLQGRTRGRVCA